MSTWLSRILVTGGTALSLYFADRQKLATVPPAGGPQQSVPATPPPALEKLAVDERLFLTYVLQDLYGDWSTDTSDPQRLKAGLADLKVRAITHHEYVKGPAFDARSDLALA